MTWSVKHLVHCGFPYVSAAASEMTSKSSHLLTACLMVQQGFNYWVSNFESWDSYGSAIIASLLPAWVPGLPARLCPDASVAGQLMSRSACQLGRRLPCCHSTLSFIDARKP